MAHKPEESDILKIAEAAGLQKAIARYRDEVLAAAKAAFAARDGFEPPEDARAEPWPPMKPGDAL